MKSYSLFFGAALLSSVAVTLPANACDLHSVATSFDQSLPSASSFRLDVIEHFTESRRLQENGRYASNDRHELLLSSQTLLTAAYDLSNFWTVEASLPYINRSFHRLTSQGPRRGAEAGIGDLNFRVLGIPYRDDTPGQRRFIQLSAGIKLPTGDSDALAPETHEHPRHGGVIHGPDEDQHSAIHGHDLALGSGSVDFPIGAAFYVQHGRLSADGKLEYSIRTEGDHSYRYANDLRWMVGAGIALSATETSSVTAKINLSGLHKGKDRMAGERDNSTSLLAWFIGPELSLNLQRRFEAFLAYDVPLEMENSGLQLLPNYRIRVGALVRF